MQLRHGREGDGEGGEDGYRQPGVALRRLCEEYFDLGDVLSLVFSDPQILDDADWCGFDTAEDDRFTAMVERGHRDGSIDPELPASWLMNVLWAQLYASWS